MSSVSNGGRNGFEVKIVEKWSWVLYLRCTVQLWFRISFVRRQISSDINGEKQSDMVRLICVQIFQFHIHLHLFYILCEFVMFQDFRTRQHRTRKEHTDSTPTRQILARDEKRMINFNSVLEIDLQQNLFEWNKTLEQNIFQQSFIVFNDFFSFRSQNLSALLQ